MLMIGGVGDNRELETLTVNYSTRSGGVMQIHVIF